MALDSTWFSEAFESEGSAFSLKITAKLVDEQTPYQRIEVYQTTHFGKLMVIDGCVMLTDRDNFIYHEMLSHPALYTHPAPRKVVIIGGGDCGTLKEVLKHPGVEEAWQVEIDERVTRIAEVHFPELCTSNNDPRARLYFGDGIRWIKEADAESIDVIIVDSTDPVGPAEGLFSRPFYEDCLRALRRSGVLVQQSESPLYHKKLIYDMRDAMQDAGFSTTQTVYFPQCVYPSGWWSASMATKNGDLTRYREQDAQNKPFATRYYNAAMHRAALAAPEFMLSRD